MAISAAGDTEVRNKGRERLNGFLSKYAIVIILGAVTLAGISVLIEPDWVHLDTDENGIKMNSYFVQHPEMILGEMKMVSGRFGMEATCVPYENADLAAQLDEAVANIHGEITEYETEEELEEEDNSIPADPTVRNFSYTVVDDKIYYRENSRMTPVEVSATAENRIKGMIAIRNSVRTLIELQTEDYPDSEIKAEQERLNRLYDTFSGKYGLINSRANTSAFSQDSSFSLLSALEIIGEDGELERKADMFSKRTIKPHTPVTSVDTASEALAVSLGEKATIDMDYMMELSGKSENEIFEDLKGVIFLNPLYEYGNSYEPKYLMADEYLSGNVREKLRIAKNSAELYPEDYKVNVEALQKVQPKDLTASEISVRLGATWLPPDDVQEFIFHLLETPRYAQWNIKVHFSPFTSEWNIEGKSYDKGNVRAYNTYGTSRINAYKIIEETLNLKDVRIFDYIEDDEGKKKAVLNKKETAIAHGEDTIYMTHGHLFNVNMGLTYLSLAAKEKNASLCFYGHTHKLAAEMVDGILYLNPGSISQPRGKYSHLKTYAIVETSEKEIEVAFYTQNHEKLSDLTFTFPRED